MRGVFTVGLFASLISILVSPAAAQVLVTVPNGAETGNPSLGTCVPFGNSGGIGGWRYQQIFDAGSFGNTSGIIDKLRFRRGSNQGPFDSVLDLEIRLSHTTRASSNISATFAENATEPQVVVLPRSTDPSTFPVLASQTADPNAFDVLVELDDVFLYNGVDNLLLDVVVHGTTVLNDPDGVCISYDGFSAFGSVAVSTDPGGSVGFLVVNGLVTQFEFLLPAPEIAVSPTNLDFGSVAILDTLEMPVTISNTGTQELLIGGISVVGDSSFSVQNPIASLPVGQTHDLFVSFSPMALGSSQAALEISSDDPDEPMVSVPLVADGVGTDTGMAANELEILVADAIAGGALSGTGRGRAGESRLSVFSQMVERAVNSVLSGRTGGSCARLSGILAKADGQSPPPDLVEGPAREDIESAVRGLMARLQCR